MFNGKRKGTFGIGDVVRIKGNPTLYKVSCYGAKYKKPGTLGLRYVSSGNLKNEFIHYTNLSLAK
jgi:hypothetical protein